MSRNELPRAGLVQAALAGRISNREGAAALRLSPRQFNWLESRGPAMTLLGAIDDATSEVVALHFRPTEDLHGYATLLQQIFTTVGLPVALYGDGVNILVRNDHHWSLDEQLAGGPSADDADLLATVVTPKGEFTLVARRSPSAARSRARPPRSLAPTTALRLLPMHSRRRRADIPGAAPTIRCSPSAQATLSTGDDIFMLQYPRHSY